MEVHFHSDSSNNDWGVRMSAYGIMQVGQLKGPPQVWRNGQAMRKISADIYCFTRSSWFTFMSHGFHDEQSSDLLSVA